MWWRASRRPFAFSRGFEGVERVPDRAVADGMDVDLESLLVQRRGQGPERLGRRGWPCPDRRRTRCRARARPRSASRARRRRRSWRRSPATACRGTCRAAPSAAPPRPHPCPCPRRSTRSPAPSACRPHRRPHRPRAPPPRRSPPGGTSGRTRWRPAGPCGDPRRAPPPLCGGTSRRTSPAASSRSAPDGSPVTGSRSMRPYGGSGVAFVTPASASAFELTQTECPSVAERKTGRSGHDAIEQRLRRIACREQRQLPAAAADPLRLRDAPPRTRGPPRGPPPASRGRSGRTRCASTPPEIGCTCESWKAGRSILPARSTTRVFGPVHAAAPASVPT